MGFLAPPQPPFFHTAFSPSGRKAVFWLACLVDSAIAPSTKQAVFSRGGASIPVLGAQLGRLRFGSIDFIAPSVHPWSHLSASRLRLLHSFQSFPPPCLRLNALLGAHPQSLPLVARNKIFQAKISLEFITRIGLFYRLNNFVLKHIA